MWIEQKSGKTEKYRFCVTFLIKSKMAYNSKETKLKRQILPPYGPIQLLFSTYSKKSFYFHLFFFLREFSS
ncbi:hypothetical protein MtrunA17_Chr8g0369671 [Medicago truncatula]|uniref:Uncharacterized protein n=1 Tax=Medicago truncatula TaxID=3880 RepID=A0A396GT02_MEDTR|nr:hypothetical protein MtrunA17_Chr8g0369671 [Medicago truncatula]